MKKFLCVFCSLVIILCIGGCDKAVENDVTDDTSVSEQVAEDNSINIFNDEDSITVITGNLSYSIPGSVQDQYDELQKDKGFEIPSFQKYDIDSVGEISIYQANMYHNEEFYLKINDMGESFIKVLNSRAHINSSFNKDERYEFSIFNGVNVDIGFDMYMCTDNDDIKKAESYGFQFEQGEERIIIIMKGFSVYIIRFEFELGEYNKQIIDTFLDSIEFISLEDF